MVAQRAHFYYPKYFFLHYCPYAKKVTFTTVRGAGKRLRNNKECNQNTQTRNEATMEFSRRRKVEHSTSRTFIIAVLLIRTRHIRVNNFFFPADKPMA